MTKKIPRLSSLADGQKESRCQLSLTNIGESIKNSTIEQYDFTIRSFAKFVPNPKLRDLTRENVNSWLLFLQQSGQSPETVKSKRNQIIGIWRAAFETGHTENEPKRIRKIKTPDLLVKALTVDQIETLFEEISRLKRFMPNCKIRRRDYLRTLTKATLDTSLRQSDLHELEWRDLQTSNGRVTIIQVKTGFRRPAVISEETLEDIRAVGYDGRYVWPAPKPDYIPRIYQSFGVTHTLLRKTAITRQEKKRPGTGWIFAGHRSPETTRRWYTDHEMAYEDIL